MGALYARRLKFSRAIPAAPLRSARYRVERLAGGPGGSSAARRRVVCFAADGRPGGRSAARVPPVGQPAGRAGCGPGCLCPFAGFVFVSDGVLAAVEVEHGGDDAPLAVIITGPGGAAGVGGEEVGEWLAALLAVLAPQLFWPPAIIGAHVIRVGA